MMPVSLPALRVPRPGAPRWELALEGRRWRVDLPADHADEFALATLNNALCTFAPARIASYVDAAARRTVEAAIASLRAGGASAMLDVARRIHAVDAVELPVAPLERAPNPSSQGAAPPPPRREGTAPVIGVDIGGTDGKVVVIDGERVLYAAEPAWDVPLSELERGEDFVEAASRLVDEAIAAAGRPFAAIGVSWPDIVVNDAIVGGMTSKTRGLRARHGGFTPAYRAAFDAHVRTLAHHLSERYGVPVAVANDGPAAAAFAAAVLQSPGVLCLSLGTSVAGGLVDAHGVTRPLPLYTSGLVVRLGEAADSAHGTTGLTGAVQQLCSQIGAFRLTDAHAHLAPKARLEALLADPAQAHLLAALGAGLADTVAEIRFWLGPQSFDRVVLFGRLTASPGPLLAAAQVPGVRFLLASELGAPWRLDPQTYGQAVGAALLALERV